jgi:Raf kinase inhibitor-like YbhB/YbcL family protein
MRALIWIAVIVVALQLAGCRGVAVDGTPSTQEDGEDHMRLTSAAFADGDTIPARYTCSGEDVSPPLVWNNTPDGTASFALIGDDPDAPGRIWVHWVIYNIPSTSTSLDEEIPAQERLGDGSLQGRNDFRRIGYGGPCPPPGNPHRYFFKLYALDSQLELGPGVTKAELEAAMEGHILAEAQLMGTFGR